MTLFIISSGEPKIFNFPAMFSHIVPDKRFSRHIAAHCEILYTKTWCRIMKSCLLFGQVTFNQGVEPNLNRKPKWTVSFWWTRTEPEPAKFYFSEPEPNLNPQNCAQVNPNRTWTPNKVRIYFSISECRWRWYTHNKSSGDHQQDQQFLLFFFWTKRLTTVKF